ncbi:hypothetical protein ACFQZF_10175 [Flavobacterium myungsuense]|uniref:hypothetical protein n=1 Tax=Flavobacterium myungsuense TaxID=651823 RepID=UPI0036334701
MAKCLVLGCSAFPALAKKVLGVLVESTSEYPNGSRAVITMFRIILPSNGA